jgi:LmbE family N-acetylglucosaminyl deacetylase
MSDSLRVLGVFPHPDDESYSCSATLAMLASRGAVVQIICASAGQTGQDLRNDRGTTDLASARLEELARSCAAIGARPPRCLGLPDGKLAELDFPVTVGAIVHEIRRARPHIVVALGEDGVYGHPDHIALYRLIVAALAAAPGGERFPASEFGDEWAPSRVFLVAYPRGMFRPMFDLMLGSEYRAYFRALDPDGLGVDPAAVAAAVDIRTLAELKLAAIRCHRSQLQDGDPFKLFPDDLVRRTLTTELFSAGPGWVRPDYRLRSLDQGLEF